jgi:uncharacterized RDD family membrane protein YckC
MLFTIIGGDGREYGPVTKEQVRAWMIAGRADEDTKARLAGTEEWKVLGDFPELAEAEPPVARAEDAFVAPDEPVLAGRLTRFWATLLDMALGLVCVLPGALLLGTDMVTRLLKGEWPDDFNVGRTASGFLVLGLALFVLFVVQTWLLTTRGQSVGKRMLGIRIVRYRTAAPPGFLHAVLLRSWVINVIGLVPTLGTYFPLLDIGFIFGPERRCLHDLIADTMVVAGQPAKD